MNVFFLTLLFFGGRGAKPLHILIIIRSEIRSEIVITGPSIDKSIVIDRLPFLPDRDNSTMYLQYIVSTLTDVRAPPGAYIQVLAPDRK